MIFTTAEPIYDYGDTERRHVVGHLPGGGRLPVHLVVAARPDRQASLYLAVDALAADISRFQRMVKRRQVIQTAKT